jgi:hypothetical protein
MSEPEIGATKLPTIALISMTSPWMLATESVAVVAMPATDVAYARMGVTRGATKALRTVISTVTRPMEPVFLSAF